MNYRNANLTATQKYGKKLIPRQYEGIGRIKYNNSSIVGTVYKALSTTDLQFGNLFLLFITGLYGAKNAAIIIKTSCNQNLLLIIG